MADSTDSNKFLESETTYFENTETANYEILTNETLNASLRESQDFKLVDTVNTDDGSQNVLQIMNDTKPEELKDNNICHTKLLKPKYYEDQLPSNSIKDSSFHNIDKIKQDSVLDKKENSKSKDYATNNSKESLMVRCTSSCNSVLTQKENNELLKPESLKRKALSSRELATKYLKTTFGNDTLRIEKYEKEKNSITLEDNKIITDTREIVNHQNLNTNDNIVHKANIFKQNKILGFVKKNNEAVETNIADRSYDINLSNKSNFLISIKDGIDNSLSEFTENINHEACSQVDSFISMQGANLSNKNSLKISLINKTNFNVNSEVENKKNEKNSNDDNFVQSTNKSRKSIEVIYDKSIIKAKSKELVEINESGEKIILDSSQEESNSKQLQKSFLNEQIIYKRSINKTKNESNFQLVKNFSESTTEIIKVNDNNNEKMKSEINNENICNASDDILIKYENHQPNCEIINKRSNFTPSLAKNENSTIVTISDSDNSLIEDCGKDKLEDVGFNNNHIKLKQVEKEVNFSLKLKYLLSIDEKTKEIYQKEIVNALCEPSNTIHLMHQKNVDSSSTACFADISANENKDNSPASIISNPQLYQLQPTRLSFISTISSSSSSSSAVSLAPRTINRENRLFSQPQVTAKQIRKPINNLSLEERHNWEIVEKVVKEWKNSFKIVSAITNILNNEINNFDFVNGSSDLLENSEMLHSSTPGTMINITETKKSPLSNIKKTKTGKGLKNVKIVNNNLPVHRLNKTNDNNPVNLISTLTIPIDKYKIVESFPSQVLQTEPDNEFFGKEVFAKWSDNNYYPGKVSDIVEIKIKTSVELRKLQKFIK